MKQYVRTALTALVALAGFAFLTGCQMSGHTDRTSTRSDTSMRNDRMDRGGDMAMRTPAMFDQTYEATRDTEWVSSTAADAERGTLMRGDRVMLDRGPMMDAQWQEARTTTGRTVYIRPADFRRAS